MYSKIFYIILNVFHQNVSDINICFERCQLYCVKWRMARKQYSDKTRNGGTWNAKPFLLTPVHWDEYVHVLFWRNFHSKTNKNVEKWFCLKEKQEKPFIMYNFPVPLPQELLFHGWKSTYMLVSHYKAFCHL